MILIKAFFDKIFNVQLFDTIFPAHNKANKASNELVNR